MRRFIHAVAVGLLLTALATFSEAAVVVSVGFAPPVLPLYSPPPMPAPGYMWLPGYWAWSPGGYYWVPGTWALAPSPGLLWTPGYWGWSGGAYLWHAGYWGPHVGFYGGINYGFGYLGSGYRGGYWRGGRFVVNTTIINAGPVNRVSFNGGAGGVLAHASPGELHAEQERRFGMTAEQRQHEQGAARDNTLRAAYNHGSPPVAGTQHAGTFYGRAVVPAHAPLAAGSSHTALTAQNGHFASAAPGTRGFAGAGYSGSRGESEARSMEAGRAPDGYAGRATANEEARRSSAGGRAPSGASHEGQPAQHAGRAARASAGRGDGRSAARSGAAGHHGEPARHGPRR
jgi:hypothetical protein